MKTTIFSFCICFVIQQVCAAPTYLSSTGHSYEPIAILHPFGEGYTWYEVRDLAATSTYLGVQGHLATITSAEENQFVANLCDALGHDTFYWLGGYQPEGTPEPNDGWQWVTGESWTYANWKAGEPNDAGTFGVEDHVGIVGSSDQGLLGQWNDMYAGVNPDRNWSSYVIEYPVPEPATFSLFALGGIGLIWQKKARLKAQL